MSRRENNERVEAAMRGAHFGKVWIRASCPFCEDDGHRDRKQSLAINQGTGRWFCHRCASRGRLDEPPNPSLALQDAVEEKKDYEAVEPPEGYTPLYNDRSITFEPARAYLKGRGVSRATMREMQIGACAKGWWAGRIIVPFTSSLVGGGWLGWVARLWRAKPRKNAEGKDAKKYLNMPGMPAGLQLFNHDALFVETDEPLLIVEGMFDTFPFWPNAAAVLGKPSHKQVEAMAQATRPLAIVLDGDAWRESWALAARLRFDGARAGYVRLPPQKDPDEVDRAWLIEESKRCVDAPL